ncbi:hypothetical protein M0813_17195 [Anaeramoeba flamelloides]|uniref:Uncharacterized protein n=1 Tax=Anaeramoeba flamelloides TaxID=1746091 RepID=A0ABQ8YXM8_9EUKA|nr:hypothetical protein M0813_17195 [Anaeramoeba flamelloides]
MTVSKSDREIYSPSALQTNYIALWILSITFFAITLLVLFELIQNYHIYRKEKKMNLLIVYRGMILITCFFNTFSRTIVALFDIPWKTQGLLYFFVYIINNFFQFCMGIYDTLDGFGKNKLNTIIMSQNNGNKNRFFIVYTIWYIFFEGIPVLVLVFAFHKQIKLELKLFNFLEPKETGNTYFYSSVIDTNEYSGLNSSTNYINNSSVEDDFETEDDSVFSTSEN